MNSRSLLVTGRSFSGKLGFSTSDASPPTFPSAEEIAASFPGEKFTGVGGRPTVGEWYFLSTPTEGRMGSVIAKLLHQYQDDPLLFAKNSEQLDADEVKSATKLEHINDFLSRNGAIIVLQYMLEDLVRLVSKVSCEPDPSIPDTDTEDEKVPKIHSADKVAELSLHLWLAAGPIESNEPLVNAFGLYGKDMTPDARKSLRSGFKIAAMRWQLEDAKFVSEQDAMYLPADKIKQEYEKRFR
eukprot:g1351.t1